MIVYTDGRPTKVAILVEENNETIGLKITDIPFSTNFEAEYRAIIEALKWLRAHREMFRYGTNVTIANDNATVVSQLKKKARVFEPRLKELWDEVMLYVANLPFNVEFTWVARDENKAHALF